MAKARAKKSKNKSQKRRPVAARAAVSEESTPSRSDETTALGLVIAGGALVAFLAIGTDGGSAHAEGQQGSLPHAVPTDDGKHLSEAAELGHAAATNPRGEPARVGDEPAPGRESEPTDPERASDSNHGDDAELALAPPRPQETAALAHAATSATPTKHREDDDTGAKPPPVPKPPRAPKPPPAAKPPPKPKPPPPAVKPPPQPVPLPRATARPTPTAQPAPTAQPTPTAQPKAPPPATPPAPAPSPDVNPY